MASIPDLLKKTEEAILKVEHRPFDRFLLGPFLIWYGLQSRSMGNWPRRAIIAGGIYQVVYAWTEYRKLYGAVRTSPTHILRVVRNESVLDI